MRNGLPDFKLTITELHINGPVADDLSAIPIGWIFDSARNDLQNVSACEHSNPVSAHCHADAPRVVHVSHGKARPLVFVIGPQIASPLSIAVMVTDDGISLVCNFLRRSLSETGWE